MCIATQTISKYVRTTSQTMSLYFCARVATRLKKLGNRRFSSYVACRRASPQRNGLMLAGPPDKLLGKLRFSRELRTFSRSVEQGLSPYEVLGNRIIEQYRSQWTPFASLKNAGFCSHLRRRTGGSLATYVGARAVCRPPTSENGRFSGHLRGRTGGSSAFVVRIPFRLGPNGNKVW